MAVLTEEFIYHILSYVDKVPYGKVASYGQIATLAGYPQYARLVGKILSLSEFYGEYPCHRIVNTKGRIAPHYKEQKALLLAEGVTFKDANHINILQHRWNVTKKQDK